MVLHIQEGTQEGSLSWFLNPQSKVSAHFLNAKDGRLWQVVDTDDRSWAQTGGNTRGISVENEGHSGDRLTGSQLHNCAVLLGWLHQTDGVPLQLSDNANTPGLAWHGMNGGAWGHPDCPGAPIVAQRQQIIDLAIQGADVPLTAQDRTDIQNICDKAVIQSGAKLLRDEGVSGIKGVVDALKAEFEQYVKSHP